MKKITSLLALFVLVISAVACNKTLENQEGSKPNTGNGGNNGNGNGNDQTEEVTYVKGVSVISNLDNVYGHYAFTYDDQDNIETIIMAGIEQYDGSDIDITAPAEDFDYYEVFNFTTSKDKSEVVIEYNDESDPSNMMKVELTFNGDNYVSQAKVYRYAFEEKKMELSRTYTYTYADGYMATSRMVEADASEYFQQDDCTYTWSNGNVVKTYDIMTRKGGQKDHFRTEYSYSAQVVAPTNISAISMFATLSIEELPLPAKWFGAAPKNVITAFDNYEKYDGDDDWKPLSDDNANILKTELDENNLITSIDLSTKYHNESVSSVKGHQTLNFIY